MQDDELESLYVRSIEGLKFENDACFNSFIAYRTMIGKILDLPLLYDAARKIYVISADEIHNIIKNEQEKLKEENKKIGK